MFVWRSIYRRVCVYVCSPNDARASVMGSSVPRSLPAVSVSVAPLASPSAKTYQSMTPTGPQPSAGPAASRGRGGVVYETTRMVVVDDEPANLRVSRHVLTRLGVPVENITTLTNGVSRWCGDRRSSAPAIIMTAFPHVFLTVLLLLCCVQARMRCRCSSGVLTRRSRVRCPA